MRRGYIDNDDDLEDNHQGLESSSATSDSNYQIKTMSDTEVRVEIGDKDDDLEAFNNHQSIESSSSVSVTAIK